MISDPLAAADAWAHNVEAAAGDAGMAIAKALRSLYDAQKHIAELTGLGHLEFEDGSMVGDDIRHHLADAARAARAAAALHLRACPPGGAG